MHKLVHFIHTHAPRVLWVVPLIGLTFIFREVVFGHAIFSYYDVLTNYLPYYTYQDAGGALINTSLLAGFPTAVTISAAWFDPMRQLFALLFDALNTYVLLTLLYLAIAYIATYLFALKLGAQQGAAVLAGATYIFAGQILLWSGAIGIAVYYALLPLTLLLLTVALQSWSWKSVVALICIGLLLGFGWLSGHVQFLVYIYLLLGVYWLYLALLNNQKTARYWLWHGMGVVLVISLSLILGFPQIVAVLKFLPYTLRTDIPMSQVMAYSYLPPHLIHYLIPSFAIPYPPNISPAFQNYIGIIPLLFISIGVAVHTRLWRIPHMAFFAAVFVFCLVASIKYSPIAYLFHALPVFNGFRETVRIMFIGDFALALCVGLFATHLWSERATILPQTQRLFTVLRVLFMWVVLPVVSIFTALMVVFFAPLERLAQQYFLTKIYPHTSGNLPLEHYYTLIHTHLFKTMSQLSLFNGEIVALIVCSAAGYLLIRKSPTLHASVFWSALVGISVCNMAIVYATHIQTIPKETLTTTPKTALFLQEQLRHSGPFRIMSPLWGISFFNESVRCKFPSIGSWQTTPEAFAIQQSLLVPNTSLYYDIAVLDGYEPYMTARMSHLVSYLGSGFSMSDNIYGVGTHDTTLSDKWSELLQRLPVYQAYNVRYLLSLHKLTDSRITKVFEETIGACNTTVYVYELADPWPQHFLTNNTRILETDDFLATMRVLQQSTKPIVILPHQDHAIEKAPSFMIPLEPTVSGNALTFTTNSPHDGYAVIGNAWLPGYRAYLDGAAVELLRVNYTVLAVRVPKGRHTLEIHYTPPTTIR